LNRSVGGLNPLAVEIAAREGARCVWLPTVDSVAEAQGLDLRPGATPPVWLRLQQELRARGIAVEPVAVVDGEGRLLPEARAVLATIAGHGLFLATGHLGFDETLAVVDAAHEEGVADVVVTHPDYTAQRFSSEEQRELADRGALIERCFTTPHTDKVSWEDWL